MDDHIYDDDWVENTLGRGFSGPPKDYPIISKEPDVGRPCPHCYGRGFYATAEAPCVYCRGSGRLPRGTDPYTEQGT